nr:hypothetical protein [Bacillaceae bacterium]
MVERHRLFLPVQGFQVLLFFPGPREKYVSAEISSMIPADRRRARFRMPGDVIPGEKQSTFETAGGSSFPLMNGERTKRVFGDFLPSARRMDSGV